MSTPTEYRADVIALVGDSLHAIKYSYLQRDVAIYAQLARYLLAGSAGTGADYDAADAALTSFAALQPTPTNDANYQSLAFIAFHHALAAALA